jgi:hypothetical protein
MIVVYGKGESEERFGPITSLNCKNCKISNKWTVQKTTDWFTLYFIPVIPFNKYKILCLNCQHTEIIPKAEFKIYWEFLTLSEQIGESVPNSNQLKTQRMIEEKLNKYNQKKMLKIKSEISQFDAVVSKMSNTDLMHRYHYRDGYSATFLLAVEEEILSRKIKV